MEKDNIEISSDSIQKEFENNPLKILELIINEKEMSLKKESEKNIEHKNKRNENKNSIISHEKEEKKFNLLDLNAFF